MSEGMGQAAVIAYNIRGRGREGKREPACAMTPVHAAHGDPVSPGHPDAESSRINATIAERTSSSLAEGISRLLRLCISVPSRPQFRIDFS